MAASTPLPTIATAAARDPWRSHPARILRITDEIPGVRTYDVALGERAVRDAFRFTPGQFNMLHLPGIGEAAVSISSDPRCPDTLSHTVRAVGNVTNAVARLSEGAGMLLRGPFGRPWPLRLSGVSGDQCGHAETVSDLVFVAGGLGLASQRSAILEAVHDRSSFGRVVVIHGAKTPAGLLYAREYDAWRSAGIEVELVVDQGGVDAGGDRARRAATGTVLTLLESLPLDSAKAMILACGPDAMMAAVGRLAIGRGVAASRVFLSLERNMACAVGHCGLCQFGPEFVCRDGPVFSLKRIAGYLAVPRL